MKDNSKLQPSNWNKTLMERNYNESNDAKPARAGIYLHTVLFDDGSPLFNLFENSILVGPDGQKKKFEWKADDTAKQNWWMSLASEDWTNHLLKQAEYIMEILNPDAIVVDETFLCVGVSNGWEEYTGLNALDASTRNRLLRDIKILISKK